MKSWQCPRCGKAVERGVVTSLAGRPSECDNCGSDDFDDPVTMGSFHSKIDRIFP